MKLLNPLILATSILLVVGFSNWVPNFRAQIRMERALGNRDWDKVLEIAHHQKNPTQNVVPLNFRIVEQADAYRVFFTVDGVRKAVFRQREIRFETKEWHSWLQTGKTSILAFVTYLKRNGKWYRHPDLRNTVVPDTIDRFLTYRLIEPSYVTYNDLTIKQASHREPHRLFVQQHRPVLSQTQNEESGSTRRCFRTHPFGSHRRKSQRHLQRHQPDGHFPCKGEALINKYQQVRYSIERMPFDSRTRRFGKAERLYDASVKGKSASLPRLSPDGRYLLFTLADYRTFHIWHKSSDLHLINLATGQERKLENVNSPEFTVEPVRTSVRSLVKTIEKPAVKTTLQ